MAKKPTGKIINKVLDCPTVPWAQLTTFEANRLKAAEKRNVAKLKKVILEEDFCFPLVVWKAPKDQHPYVIDGAGRMQALRELEKEGVTICDIPVVFVQAESKEQAKRLVAMASSQYGYVTADSFAAFAADIGGAAALMPSIAINSTAFATDYIGPVVGPEEESERPKRGRLTAQTFEPPEFEPEDIIDLGPHQLMVGHDQPEIIAKVLKFCRKEWPDIELKRNGDPLP